MTKKPSIVIKVPKGTPLTTVSEIRKCVGSLEDRYTVSIRSSSNEKEGRSYCWYCGGQLVWQSDYNFDEVFGEGEGIVSHLMCSDCGAMVEYALRDDEEEDDEDENWSEDELTPVG